MKKKLILMTASAMLMLGLTGTAQAAPGADIKEACGASFGALVSSAKSSGIASLATSAAVAAFLRMSVMTLSIMVGPIPAALAVWTKCRP